MYRYALEIYRAVGGADHSNYANALNNLAFLHRVMGYYDEARQEYSQALDILRRTAGERHPDYAQTLNNMGAPCRVTGDYAAAERHYQRALVIFRETVGDAHPLFAGTLNNIAELQRETGNYSAAEPLYLQALEVRRAAFGEEHPDVATSLNNLGLTYEGMGDYISAALYYKQAVDIFQKTVGEKHSYFIMSLLNQIRMYELAGDYSIAESLYEQALEIQSTALGESHPGYGVIVNNLAELYRHLGNYAAAEPLYRKALEIDRRAFGEEHHEYAIGLNNLALVYVATGRETDALNLMKQATSIHDRMIGQVFSIGSETRRMAYLSRLRADFATFLSLILEHCSQSSSAVQTGLDLVLRRKGIGAEALAIQRDVVLEDRYQPLKEQLRKLTTLRKQIAEKVLSDPNPNDSETQQLLAEWGNGKELLEADLVRQIPEMNLEIEFQKANRQNLAKTLHERSALIEFVRFEVRDFKAIPARDEPSWKPAHYVAFVMPAREPDDVSMVDLGEAEPIDQLIAAFRNSITREGENRSIEDPAATTNGKDRAHERDPAVLRAEIGAYSQSLEETRGLVPDYEGIDGTPDGKEEGVRLREAVFDKLVPHLRGHKRLFLAPDGELYRLPFEALPTSDGHHLIDEYLISYLGSGRDVLRFDADSTVQAGPPLVAADPDFDLGGAGVTASSRNVGFRRLSGTREEGERIADKLGVTPLLGDDPLEAAVKNARSPRILHIASHGFFRPDAPRDPNEEAHELRTMGGLDGGLLGRLAHVENPLLRSGLALVGANTWLKGGSLPEDAEDGILMAEDVTGMDLLATELAVLSACQTGLGEVHSGEGVYGLRRAFVVAGAKTLVMSLWKVPDKQTRELMEHFYRLLLQGEPRAEALRQAQLEMKKKYADPFYWGAFICQGVPRSLPEHELPRVSGAGHDH
jgi:CHAT domain-containing protein/tetratricopeptide (TPR) repeat protein